MGRVQDPSPGGRGNPCKAWEGPSLLPSAAVGDFSPAEGAAGGVVGSLGVTEANAQNLQHHTGGPEAEHGSSLGRKAPVSLSGGGREHMNQEEEVRGAN